MIKNVENDKNANVENKNTQTLNNKDMPTPLPPSAQGGGELKSQPSNTGGELNQEINNVETASNEDSQTQDSLIEYIKQTTEKINLLDFDIEFYLFYVSNEMKKILETIKDKDKRIIYWYLERISEDSKIRFLSNDYMQYAYLYEAFQKLKEMLPTPLPPSAQGGGELKSQPSNTGGESKSDLPTSINIENENVDIQELESILNLIQKNLKTSQELYRKVMEARAQLIEKLRVLKAQALETES